MKLYFAFTLLIASVSTTIAMHDPKQQAKEQFLTNSQALHKQYQTHTRAQMRQGTPGYAQLHENSQKLLEAHKRLDDLGEATKETQASLTTHYLKLLEIIKANEQPEPKANL